MFSFIKSFFFPPSKFSNWLSRDSDWISVHLKLGGDTNQQKPEHACGVNAVVAGMLLWRY